MTHYDFKLQILRLIQKLKEGLKEKARLDQEKLNEQQRKKNFFERKRFINYDGMGGEEN